MELKLNNLTVGYPRRGFSEERILFSRLDAVFGAGELTAIVGRNGTGKSTLLRVMAGLARPLSGEVIFRDSGKSAALSSEIAWSFTPGKFPSRFSRQRCISSSLTKNDAGRLARIVGFVSTERIRVTNLKVYDMVALGRSPYTGRMGRLTPADRAAVDEALALAGMTGFAAKQLDTLSDGEAQRAMIARVLAQDTPVILLDEPTAFLDFVARREVCELLLHLARRQGKTVVFSSHELDLVDEFATRRLTLSGEVVSRDGAGYDAVS